MTIYSLLLTKEMCNMAAYNISLSNWSWWKWSKIITLVEPVQLSPETDS